MLKNYLHLLNKLVQEGMFQEERSCTKFVFLSKQLFQVA